MDEVAGFFVVLLVLVLIVVLMSVWFAVFGASALVVAIGFLGFLLLSPWFIKGLIQGWREARDDRRP